MGDGYTMRFPSLVCLNGETHEGHQLLKANHMRDVTSQLAVRITLACIHSCVPLAAARLFIWAGDDTE
eukprot:4652519-Amphidinium_carterae.1